MREIKFRVWEGNDFDYNPLGIGRHEDYCVDINEWLKEENVTQYTGLKDKNGKEIYEGDIVRYTNEKANYEKIEITFINGMFRVGYYDLRPDYFTEDGRNLEVIGNIYENPELLK